MIVFGMLVMLAAMPWPAPATPAGGSLDERIAGLKAAYNRGILGLSPSAPSIDTAQYESAALSAIVSAFEVGEVVVASRRPIFAFPGLGRRYAARGELIVSDAEEASPKAARTSYRLYMKGAGDGSTGFWVIPVDVSGLPDAQRAFIDRHCGNAFACKATVYGRIGEIEAERKTNPFSVGRSVSVVIGLVGDHVRFHEIRP